MTKLGRPSSYSPALAAEILDRVANGEALNTICRDDGMPHRVTVLRWTYSHDDFKRAYEQATALSALAMTDDLLTMHVGARDAQMYNARARTIQWLAAKALPSRFGDKLAIEVDNKVSIRAALDAGMARIAAGKVIEHDPDETPSGDDNGFLDI